MSSYSWLNTTASAKEEIRSALSLEANNETTFCQLAVPSQDVFCGVARMRCLQRSSVPFVTSAMSCMNHKVYARFS